MTNALELLTEMDAADENSDPYILLKLADIRLVLPQLLDWAVHRSFFHPDEDRGLFEALLSKWKKRCAAGKAGKKPKKGGAK